MTGEEFRAQYYLLDRVTEGSVATHHGQASTGAMVMVHFIADLPTSTAVAERIERLAPDARKKVLRTVAVDGQTAVVTRFLLDFASLEDWLSRNARSDHQPEEPVQGTLGEAGIDVRERVESPAHSAKPATSSQQPPGDLTRMFGAVTPPSDVADRVPVTPRTDASQRPPAQESQVSRPGQLTEMFRAASLPQTPSRPEPVEGTGGWDFPTSPVADPPPPPPPDNNLAGRPESRDSWSREWPAPPSPPPSRGGTTDERESDAGPGDYTRAFGQPLGGSSDPKPSSRDPISGHGRTAEPRSGTVGPASSGGDDYLERLSTPSNPAQPLPPAPAQAPLPSGGNEPSDYTRVIKSFPPPLPPPTTTRSADPSPAGSGTVQAPPDGSNRLVIGLAVTVLLAVLFVLAVAFWKQG